MLLVTQALPKQLAQQLLQYNIRFVEQFLSIIRERRSARALQETLGWPLEDLEEIARKVEAAHPDLIVPEHSGKEYALGYGKRRDWESLEPG